MSRSTCHSCLSSTATTPDIDIDDIQLQTLMDYHNQTIANDRRFSNMDCVRYVLRKFFGGHGKRSISINSAVFDDTLTDQTSSVNNVNDNLILPILIHPCLQFDRHEKFSGRMFETMRRILFELKCLYI